MMWSVSYQKPGFYYVALNGGVILFVFGFFSHLVPLFLVAALLVLAIIVPKFYLDNIKKNVILTNKKNRIRIFTNDTGDISFEFENHSPFPIYNATVYFSADDYIECVDVDKNYTRRQNRFNIVVKAHSKGTFKIPIKAKARGLAKIRSLSIIITDPFRTQNMTLTFKELFKTDIIVYPEQKAVNGIHKIDTNEEGILPRTFALFQDMNAVTGTRDYIAGDPLKHIHWKATAKTGALQTKTFERTFGMTWSLVLLLNPNFLTRSKNEDIESLVSMTAFLCQYAKNLNINVELFVNLKPPGSEKIVYIPADNSMSHHLKLLDLLAMVQGNQMKTRIDITLSEMDRRLSYPRQIFFIQQMDENDQPDYFYQKWIRYGHQLYSVVNTEEASYVKPFMKGVATHEK